MSLFPAGHDAEVRTSGLNKEPQFRAAQEHDSLLLRNKSRILDSNLSREAL